MATAPALITMEQYLGSSYSPDLDFVDGELQERNVGEKDHGRMQLSVALWFAAREDQFGVEPVTEPRLLISDGRARICDVAVFRTDVPDEQVALTPPIICIEIMSPQDRLSRSIKVLEDYRTMGVSNIWLIDPQERLAYTFGPGGLQQQEDYILRVAATEIAMDVNQLFIDLDRKKARSTHE
ncbi:MAG: Uma2 family endonuclease [Janthinobacterium lividum]